MHHLKRRVKTQQQKYKCSNDPDSPNAKNKDLNRSSPDMNLIENIWGSMKKYMYLRTTVRPGNIEELKAGVKDKYCWTSQVGALHVS